MRKLRDLKISRCRVALTTPATFAISFFLGGCGVGLICPYEGYEAAVTISAGNTDINRAFDKVSSLMTSLDYDLSRINTINGVGPGNFLQECEPENGKERCEVIAKTHESFNQEIIRLEHGLSFIFGKDLGSGETSGGRFEIKDDNGAVRISMNFSDEKPCGGLTGFSKTAADDFAKIVTSFGRSYGSDHVSVRAPRPTGVAYIESVR